MQVQAWCSVSERRRERPPEFARIPGGPAGTGLRYPQRSQERARGCGSSSSGSSQRWPQPLQHSYWVRASSATRDLPRAKPGQGDRRSPGGQVRRTKKTLQGSLKIGGELGREVHFVTTSNLIFLSRLVGSSSPSTQEEKHTVPPLDGLRFG